ncbi:hypothetical protein SAMN05660493_00247 [Epilithonimonas bovis DSM 19482]|uniref:Uncharacterized protein n=1 Tax=Epilithonimonas bovis DSM 19482 TaxID=1121284 RepID=A0A1U7PRP9_9FLAO|nr:peptidase [Epilithonimonas bovis]SIT95599.1 hypothetical protein SAMN05660493_00247 [Epilithonimonas bovis DSM 19482]
MANHVWKVTAKRDSFTIAKVMTVEIVVRNASRKPNQKKVIDAINQKYGAKTASNGTYMGNFDMVKL